MKSFIVFLSLFFLATVACAQAEPLSKRVRQCDLTPYDIQELKNKAETGDSAASIKLATEYITGECVSENSLAARKILEKAAYSGSGDLPALHRLASTYSGWGNAPKDEAKAKQLYLNAANAGYPAAEDDVAGFYLNGMIGFEKNANQAIAWYEKAAAHGYINAVHDLASIYKLGIYTDKNKEKAEFWLRRWAETGDDIAMVELGEFLVEKNTKEDTNEAIEILEQAAQKGMYPAGGALGGIYESGTFVEKSPSQAYFWYRIAEEGSLILRDRLAAVKLQLRQDDIVQTEKEVNDFMRTYPSDPPVE